jgi:precorrin-4/cobalt-precorrin-4 C11-methyltransferase
MKDAMVWFLGAGPGDPELITRKAYRLVGEADLVLYAGSLVPAACVAHATAARVLDSSGLTLAETHALLRDCVRSGGMAVRVHTGDPALFGAMREQMALLRRDGIAYAVVPGVSASFAAAAAAKVSFTAPETVQALSIARLEGRTPVPEGQRVRDLARHGGSLAVYLSGAGAGRLSTELLAAGLAPDTPVLVAHRVGWPDERLIWSTAAAVSALMADHAECGALARQTLFLVLPGEAGEGSVSRLYDAAFSHACRNAASDGG